MSDIPSVLPDEAKQQRWANDWDAKRDLLDVYASNAIINKDFKLANLNDKERELILEMSVSAKTAYDLCPDEAIAEEIKDILMGACTTLAILKFNTKGNMIVDRVVDYHKEPGDDEEAPKKGIAKWLDNLSKRASGQEKLKVVDE